MAEINPKDRMARVKIVYYGPPLGGKTTNLSVLHRQAVEGRRGELLSINSFQDRTILFDILPLKTVGLRGFDLYVQLVAVPGQVTYTATRRVALRGADGIVFVANSAADRREENVKSQRELRQYLLEHQMDPDSIPIVLQYNKRDLPEVAPIDILDRDLNRRKEEAFPAVALRGEGVLETLSAILSRTVLDLSRRFRTLQLPDNVSAEQWVRQAMESTFKRPGLAAATHAHEKNAGFVQPPRRVQTEFGVPAEFELEPNPIEFAEPPVEAHTVRVAVPEPSLSRAASESGEAVAETYAEACAQLALELTETRAQRSLSEGRLAEIRKAVEVARHQAPGDAEAQLQRILSALGEGTDPAHAAVALWEGACRAEERLERQREELRQSQKLAAMGTLLAGVAHELNNPLSIVLGQAQLLRRTSGGAAAAERAEKIIRAAQRCSRIIENFLALARHRPMERQPISLNQVVKEAIELLAYQLRVDNIELILELAPDLPVIWADPHQIQQVIVNLVANAQQALQAVSGEHRIVVTTHRNDASSRVVLRVSDNGSGIPFELQERIFDPFFTTKPAGQGTGLGLSLCMGITEAHGGALRVESRPGQGASFLIELPVKLPVAEGDYETPPQGDSAETPPQGDSGKTILVVDDEPELVETLVEILMAEGHRVETAANGHKALAKLREGAYDVILSDIRMPELDGPGLYLRIAESHPELLPRFVFITGDRISTESSAFLEKTRVTCLAKPFSFDEVRLALQCVTEGVH